MKIKYYCLNRVRYVLSQLLRSGFGIVLLSMLKMKGVEVCVN